MKRIAMFVLVISLFVATRGTWAQAPLQKGQILPSGTLSTNAAVTAVAFSPDSAILAGGMTGHIALWDARTGQPMPPLTGFGSTVTAVAFSPDSKLLASASLWDDGKIRVWDVAGTTIRMTLDHSAPVTALAFSPNGAFLAAAATNKSIRVWNMATGRLQTDLSTTRFPATALQWLPNTNFLLSAGGGLGNRTRQEAGEPATTPAYESEGEFAVWSIGLDDMRYQAFIPGGSPFCSFSADGTRLAMAGTGARAVTANGTEKVMWNNRQVLLYSVGLSQQETQPLEPLKLSGTEISSLGLKSLEWSHDGRLVAWSSGNHVIVTPLPNGPAAVAPANGDRPDAPPKTTISPNVMGLPVGAAQLEVNKDTPTNNPLFPRLGCLAFSYDGRFLIAGDANPEANARHGIQIWGIVE